GIAVEGEHATHEVFKEVRAEIPEVRIVVHGRTAGIHAHLWRTQWDKVADAPSVGVEESQSHSTKTSSGSLTRSCGRARKRARRGRCPAIGRFRRSREAQPYPLPLVGRSFPAVCWQGDRPTLLQDTQRVPHRPLCYQLAIPETIEGHPLHRHGLTGRRD